MHHEIVFDNVFFEYPDKSFALKNLSFTINIGEKFAICGNNGAGKTTLLRLLLGLEFHQKGKIKVQELELNRDTVREIRKRIGFVFQNPDSQVFSASVYEDVAFGPRNLGFSEEEVEEKVERALEIVDLSEYKEHSPFRLSFGQRKRVAIAGVLVMDPAIIILDEPFANIDYPTRRSLQRILEKDVIEKGKTLIFTSHSRLLIENWSDNVLFLNKGVKLFVGSSSKLSDFPETEKFLGKF
ncbi:MAG: energy-coupling factor ABC transporter ATP-binding protein [Candidatus Heimdallarchaeum endolithica]|uniref:Energy-coupling factor ABC transporter ATP-binding protein n=1 Tax=Candidatus Heimdallarchaeum endolithica TaxID=2876572 RepID=A0A9Y1BT85_9ARCH|nr:MAG: energy-coupling factor ABC transporter ATP-binding protein [Candidatus Heimdallarchaeum endolithica]